jgi:hypothetical protein
MLKAFTGYCKERQINACNGVDPKLLLACHCTSLISRITKPMRERAGFAIISFIGVSHICSTHTEGFTTAY